MTTGQILACGGIALITVGLLTIFLYIPLFSSQRKKLEKKIKEEYM